MKQKVIKTGVYQTDLSAAIQEINIRQTTVDISIIMKATDPPLGDPPIKDSEIVDLDINLFLNNNSIVKFIDIGGGKVEMKITADFASKKPGTGEGYMKDSKNIIH